VSDPIRMTAHAIGAALDFNEIDAEDKFVDAPSYDALAADLVEAKAQRDSWRRIAESGLGITAETNSVPVSSKSAQSGTVSK
jgi:hypothetical protein